ncbi:MAG: potassium transporter TrkG [Bacteroidales bacterium]|nr:potassium transporter TrkG [Bacteroidales bacterium]
MRTRIKSFLLRYRLLTNSLEEVFGKALSLILFIDSIAVIALMLIHLGYDLTPGIKYKFYDFYNLSLFVLSLGGIFYFLVQNHSQKHFSKAGKLDIFIHSFLLVSSILYFIIKPHRIAAIDSLKWITEYNILYILLFLLSIFHASGAIMRFANTKLQPARLFAGSFLSFILIGSWLLILPHSLQHPISYIDSLFTSTSCVCITGLTVVNIADTFTDTGRFIMLILIQIGGLGVITFTTLFSLLAMGKTTIKTNVLIKDMFNQNNFNDVFKLMRLIFLTTFTIEIIGAIWLYEAAANPILFPFKRAIFHSISAFCNAGFSTMPDGLNTPFIKYNWDFLFAISIIVMLGSIGFPILNNIRFGLYYILQNIFKKFGLRKKYIHRANLFTLNTKIAVWMTIILVFGGMAIFYFLESSSMFKTLDVKGKLTTLLFLATTPRSGGFNCYSMSSMAPLSVLLTMFLMWIGGGPLSTGGGIKTTTFGLSMISIWNIMRGRDKVIIGDRTIEPSSILRASALIFISMLLTSIGTFIVAYFDPQINFRDIVFEVLSAISTCGLSMDVTPQLSDPSRIVLIVLMFCGRVGLLVILDSLVRNSNENDFTYPKAYIAVG